MYLNLYSVLFLVDLIIAYSSGPPDGYASNPPNFRDCTYCHSSFPPNSGDGMIGLNGLPSKYLPNQPYDIFVFLKDPGQTRWGFELTVLFNNGFQAGSLISLDNTTQVSYHGGDSLDYIKHTSGGTFAGLDSALWHIKWIAPAPGTGDVEFYIAGNAANNNGFVTGDYIYTLNITLPESSLTYISEIYKNNPQDVFFIFVKNKKYKIKLYSPKNEEILLTLFNKTGRVIFYKKVKVFKGINSIDLLTSPFSSDIYFLRIQTPDFEFNKSAIFINR